ncbi:MAG: hypothetical protein ABJE66_10170 [Deltaproteobacteria bacterium]
MARVVLDLAEDAQLARDLAAGGVFVPGCTEPLLSDLELAIRAGDEEVVVAARVVFVTDSGAGCELVACPPEVKARLAALAKASPEPALEEEEEDADAKHVARNIHERLRGLTLVQQIKAAQHGEVSERIVLERMYGKTVWDPLLRNPRVTAPEVARIARMGALPRPMLELICTNGAWLQIPEIRRALLTNPRLSSDQAVRVLRLLPKHELKLAATQTSYPIAVRDVAKRLVRDLSQ